MRRPTTAHIMEPAADELDDVPEPIGSVLREHPVRTAVLFGSRVQGTETAESDLDIAVEFDVDHSVDERHRARLELIVDLMEALDTDDIDVADLSAIRPAVGASALRTGVVLLGDADRVERLREDFERRTTHRSHEERMRAFDELLARLEETV